VEKRNESIVRTYSDKPLFELAKTHWTPEEFSALPEIQQRMVEIYRDATAPVDHDTVYGVLCIRRLRSMGKLEVLFNPLVTGWGNFTDVLGDMEQAANLVERALLDGSLAVRIEGDEMFPVPTDALMKELEALGLATRVQP
jgi:hypothetical protein